MAEIIGPAEQALSNDDIIKRFKGSLDQVTKACDEPTFQFERISLINQARLQWQMVRGMYNSTMGYGQDDYGGQQADFVPFDYGSGQEETGADVRMCPPISFMGGDAFKFMAVMGGSSPRVKAVADDIRNPDDIARAHCADVNIRDLWIKNKIDRKWKIPAFHLYTTGPCFIRGFWNTDPIKYGQSIEPEISIEVGPDGMPAPTVVGQKAYDNGDAECSFHSVLEVSVPWEAKELYGHPLNLERMLSKWSMIAKYPKQLDQYRDSDVPDDNITGSSVTASEAKQATSNPSGTAQTKKLNSWRFSEWWIPPHLYEAIQSEEARNVIKSQFARGLYLARVGSIIVEIDDREVTEEWAVVTVNRGEKIIDRPICADNVPIQRAINDMVGMSIETVLRAITQTIIDNQLIDRQAISTRDALPAEIILTALPVDGDLGKRIFQIPPAHLSDQVLPLLNAFRGWGQDISGVRPELSGGGAPTQTYREALQRKNQALQQLAPQAQAMRDAAEDLARILVILRSKYGTGTVKAQRKGAYGIETDVADMADLQSEGWHAESDDNFPLTLSDRRDALTTLLKDGLAPEVLQATGILEPSNVDETVELLGIPGFQSAMADQRKKTLDDIDELLQGEPIPGIPGPGGPAPPQPSKQPDLFDDAALVSDLMAKWLVGPVGQKHKGTPGFFNVVAAWASYKKLTLPPVPPPPPPIKGSMAVSLKAEDVPSMIPALLEAAGMSAAALQPQGPPPLPPGGPAPPPPMPGPMGAPMPIGVPPPPPLLPQTVQ